MQGSRERSGRESSIVERKGRRKVRKEGETGEKASIGTGIKEILSRDWVFGMV
jgi:hypothetical protein